MGPPWVGAREGRRCAAGLIGTGRERPFFDRERPFLDETAVRCYSVRVLVRCGARLIRPVCLRRGILSSREAPNTAYRLLADHDGRNTHLASKGLPAVDRDLDVTRLDLDRVTATAQLLRRDEGRAGSGERVVDVKRIVVLQRTAHAFDGLLRPVPVAGVVAGGNRVGCETSPDRAVSVLAFPYPTGRGPLSKGILVTTRHRRLWRGTLLTILLAAGSTALLWATVAGNVDRSYGTNGFARVPYGENGTSVAASVQQPDGKMVVVGTVITKTFVTTIDSIGFEYGGVAMRFTVDGALDPTFGGGDGIADFSLGSASYDGVSGVALDYSQNPADPRIVMSGVSVRDLFSRRVFVAVRLTAAGTLDPTFGTGGLATTDFVTNPALSHGGSDAYAYSVAVQPDGKVLLGGTAQDETALPNSDRSGFGLAITRLNEDGSLDNSFSRLHLFLVQEPSGFAWCTSLAVDEDGSIVAVGTRYNQRGALRPFLIRIEAGGGLPSMQQDLAMTEVSAVKIVPRAAGERGDIFAVGNANRAPLYDPDWQLDFAVERRHADGTPDVGFGVDGFAWVDFGGRYDVARAVNIDPQGRIVLVGPVGPQGPDDLGIARLLPSGQPDTAFGDLVPASVPPRQSGFTKIDVRHGDSAAGVGQDRDRIIVAGNWSDGTQFGAVVLTRLFGAASVITPGRGRAPEGNAGDSVRTIPVTLDKPSGDTITVDYETYFMNVFGGPQATPGQDYAPASGTVTFAPGTTSQTIPITIHGDTLYEGSEFIAVRLKNPTGPSSLSVTDTTFYIEEDDPVPVVTLGDVAVREGNSGTTQVIVPVSMSAPCSMDTLITFVTVDGTATTADDDYVSAYAYWTIPAGQTATTLAVLVNGDVKPESNETFGLRLIPSGGAGLCDVRRATNPATITILDDDNNVPPTITSLTPSVSSIWPSNGKMVPVTVQVAATGTPAPTCSISSVRSNEGSAVPGGPQWTITGPLAVNLKAERLGAGIGRIYSTVVTCTNAAGSTSRTVTVTVPHDQGKLK